MVRARRDRVTGGADVMLGVVALAVTTAALETTMPRQAAHVVASLTFGIGLRRSRGPS
jgi:hypothetical protein